MNYYDILFPLGETLFFSKIFSKIAGRIGMPEVIGMLFSGILIGLEKHIPGLNLLTPDAVTGLGFISKIGVILIMFSAGLGTDLKLIKAIGRQAVVITAAGVVTPMLFGFLAAAAFNGGFLAGREVLISDLFYGVVLTATSVSVTVATLKEAGRLSGKFGAVIISSAILDDVIGIIVLSLVISLAGNNKGETALPWIVLLKTVLFLIFVFIMGKIASKIFALIEKHFPHHRLLPIFSLAFCFFMSYVSERIFGVADITGAFAAGLFLSTNPEVSYIDRKSEIIGYMIFTPVFFSYIGISNDFLGINASMLLFGICFIAAGLLGKIIGCTGASLLCGFSFKESLGIGVGMMARAEVALVSAQKGIDMGIISGAVMPFIVLLIVVSSFVTPLLLKPLLKKIPAEEGLEELKTE